MNEVDNSSILFWKYLKNCGWSFGLIFYFMISCCYFVLSHGINLLCNEPMCPFDCECVYKTNIHGFDEWTSWNKIFKHVWSAPHWCRSHKNQFLHVWVILAWNHGSFTFVLFKCFVWCVGVLWAFSCENYLYVSSRDVIEN
jgi:hypothetical protein